MFELIGWTSDAAPFDHITTARATTARRPPAVPHRRKTAHAAVNSDTALIDAARTSIAVRSSTTRTSGASRKNSKGPGWSMSSRPLYSCEVDG